jgi:hypothetical protein
VLGALLAGRGCGHLAGELGGQAGLGRELQRETGRVRQFGAVGRDGQVDDPGEGYGEQLVQDRQEGGLVRAPLVSSASSGVNAVASPSCPAASRVSRLSESGL